MPNSSIFSSRISFNVSDCLQVDRTNRMFLASKTKLLAEKTQEISELRSKISDMKQKDMKQRNLMADLVSKIADGRV